MVKYPIHNMTQKLKSLTTSIKEETASLIASRWLKFASEIIAEGGKPIELSPYVASMVSGQFEPGHKLADYKYSDKGARDIAIKAVKIARQYLEMGMNPEVLTYFTNNR